ncbi:MAG: hypothetical protein CL663_04730 [Bacteroidetes bacterium]|nr:hypothetical protein [Bacteroidota bacterium]
MKEIKYTSFEISDYSSLVELWLKAGLPIKLNGRDSKLEIEKELKRGILNILLAKDEDKLVGTILITHDGRKGWLNRLAVLPEYRKRGLAKMLVHRAEKHLRSIGIGIFACLIEDYNSVSLEVFQKLGYIDFKGIHYLTKREHPEI